MQTPSDYEWHFDQPPNSMAVTVLRVMKGLDPITLVSHEAEDHGWQFLNTGNGAAFDMADAALVCLSNIVKLDPSVQEVADLPPGWQARRTSLGAPWHREPNLPEEDQSPGGPRQLL